ncbi:MAG: hypothetical protein HOH14_12610 [Gammaproteobacteria bacterium]|jgi:uncharacterized protein|nr:hypothetical protein [Gammaproteobacteria bacterium]MBT6044321.1 hypothetical protein [Gammaproteobacteria bacterium]
MSIDPFPERVLSRKLCNRNASINSTLPLGKLLRLSEYLYDDKGQVEVSLSFDRDEAGFCIISGSVKADVTMACQRCLEATAISLLSEIAVKVADSDSDAEKISESSSDPLDKLEVILCEEGELDLLSLVEDELILSLPIVASHDNEDCSKDLNILHDQARDEQESTDSSLGNQSTIKGLEALEKLKQELKKNTEQNE